MMRHRLSQDCPATAIPAGDEVSIPGGTEVLVTQTLGGNVTVRTDRGLFRIAREDAGIIDGCAAAAGEEAGESAENFESLF